MADYNYRLNCGQYVLHQGETPVGRVLDEVALAMDRVDGTMHKHGDPTWVRQWHERMQTKLRESGNGELADDLVVLQGRFPLEEINRCLTTSGYALKLYRTAQDGTASALDMDGKLLLPN